MRRAAMPRSLARRPLAQSRADESGFTVVEVIVAIVVVTIVMTSVAAFFVTSGRATDAQSFKQTAVQAATDAINKARSLSSIGLATGRDQASSQVQWSAAQDTSSTTKYPGVGAYVGTAASPRLTMAYDTTPGLPTNSGYSAALPTSGKTVTIDNMTFTENWFVGYCQLNASGLCTPGTAGSTTGYTQVVVDVTWKNVSCPNALCSYVTSTLVTVGATDPTFDASQSASRPQVTNPGAQSTNYNVSVNRTFTESGGTAPFTWSATGLPPGLTFTPGTATVTGKPTAAGSYNTRVTVTDSFGFASTAGFTWTTSGPVINAIADQTATVGSNKSVAASITTGGTAPYRWSATGLPNGMSIGSGTTTSNTISGTPTQSGSFPVVVTMVDATGFTDSEPFTLSVAPSITNTTPTCSTARSGGLYTCTATFQAAGNNPSYTWTDSVAGGDPAATGDTSTATVTIGRSAAGNFSFTVYATDADGVTGSTTVTWKFGP